MLMIVPTEPRPFFQTLHALLDKEGTITLGALLDAAGGQTYGLLVLLLSLPNLVPGLNIGLAPVGGVALVALGLQLFWGTRHPWIPRRLQAQSIHKGHIKHGLALLEAQLNRVRWRGAVQRPLNGRWMGLLVAWTGFLLAIPVPLPFGNQLPAAILVLLGSALLEERPGWAWLGLAATAGNTLYFASSFGLIARGLVKTFETLVF